jgi:hypothetical protein
VVRVWAARRRDKKMNRNLENCEPPECGVRGKVGPSYLSLLESWTGSGPNSLTPQNGTTKVRFLLLLFLHLFFLSISYFLSPSIFLYFPFISLHIYITLTLFIF